GHVDEAHLRAGPNEGLRSRQAGRLPQVVSHPEGLMRRDRLRVAICSLLIGTVLLGLWQAAVAGKPAGKGIPGPVAVATTAAHMLAHPFSDKGAKYMGIGVQHARSIVRIA